MRHEHRAFYLALVMTAIGATSLQAQTTMRYRFKEGDQLNYVMDQKTKTTITVAGADVEVKVNVLLHMSWKVLKVDSQGNAQVKIKVTRSKMSMDSLVGNVEVDSNEKNGPSDLAGKMMAQMNKAVAAMEITGTMLPTGEMKDLKVAEATVNAMKTIPGADQLGDLAHPDNFKDMISGIVFPTGAVMKGKSWTHKTETKSPSGNISSENVYTYEGEVEQGGLTLEKIALNPRIKIVADPKAKIKLKEIAATGQIFFDNKAGRVYESILNQTKTGVVTVMGLSLDQVSEEKTTIRLQKPSTEEKTATANNGASIVSIKLGEAEVAEKVGFSEQFETLPGVSRSFTLERSFEPSIKITEAKSEEAATHGEIKAMLESSLGVAIGKKETVKETITLDGKEITKLNVQWVERSRRGTATRSDGSVVPFVVKIGLRLKLEKAK